VWPDEATFVAIFAVCAQLDDVGLGRKMVGMAYKIGVGWNNHVINSLIDMYAKCGSIGNARDIFDKIVGKAVVLELKGCWLCKMLRHGGFSENF